MRRRLLWAMCTTLVIVAVAAGISTATAAQGWSRTPLWAVPAWSFAALAAGTACGVIAAIGAPSVRRLLVGSVVSFVVYSAVGGAMSAFDPLGVDWVASAMWEITIAVLWTGNAWAALVVPVALALLPPFRAAVVGSPVVWAHHRYGPADDDAAAEDFGIS